MASATLQKAHPITKEVIPTRMCVGIMHRGPYSQIGDSFRKLYGHLHSTSIGPDEGGGPKMLTRDCTTLGVFLDDLKTVKPEDLRSYAAVDVSSLLAEQPNIKKGWWPSDWEMIKVEGGVAAVMTVNGSCEQLGMAWHSFEERVMEMGWKLSQGSEIFAQQVHVEMDEKDDSKNVTKLIMMLDLE
jgi:DNA gyrase inhibitor GyrI